VSAPVAARLITVSFNAPCLTCDARVHAGEQAWWIPQVGCWHEDCKPPRNLATYIKDLPPAR